MSLKLFASCALALLAMTPGSAGPTVPHVVGRIPLHDGGWDILTVDPATGRVFIGRSDGVDMVDPKSRDVTPHFVRGAGFHAVTIVPGTPFAVASEKAGTVLVFDRATGRITGQVPSAPDADAMIYEPSSRTVWVMNGDSGTITIVDPVTARATGKIAVGGSLEFPALDGRGHLFVNIEDKAELAEIDIANRKVIRRTKLAGCEKPTGLAFIPSGTLLSACANGVAKVTRASDGAALEDLVIGPRPDGAFADDKRQRAYIPSGGDGTLAVIDTSGPLPRKIGTVQTQVSARTGAVDPATGAVYLPVAKFGAAPKVGRPPIVTGSVELLIVQ